MLILLMGNFMAGAQAKPAADLIITNAKIWTVDKTRPHAEALAVLGERIVAVGMAAVGRHHEHLARHLFHGAQDGLIRDPPPPQVELEHHLLGRILGHYGLKRGAGLAIHPVGPVGMQ